MAVKLNIPEGFQTFCDQVTDHRHTLSWIIFHTDMTKKGVQTSTKLELIGTSEQVLPADQIFASIRDNIQERAGEDLPAPQFVLCNIPVKSRDVKKNHLYFISLCPDGTSAWVNFTHASSLMPILKQLNLDSKVFLNRCLPITTLDELTLENLDSNSEYDDTRK